MNNDTGEDLITLFQRSFSLVPLEPLDGPSATVSMTGPGASSVGLFYGYNLSTLVQRRAITGKIHSRLRWQVQ